MLVCVAAGECLYPLQELRQICGGVLYPLHQKDSTLKIQFAAHRHVLRQGKFPLLLKTCSYQKLQQPMRWPILNFQHCHSNWWPGVKIKQIKKNLNSISWFETGPFSTRCVRRHLYKAGNIGNTLPCRKNDQTKLKIQERRHSWNWEISKTLKGGITT